MEITKVHPPAHTCLGSVGVWPIIGKFHIYTFVLSCDLVCFPQYNVGIVFIVVVLLCVTIVLSVMVMCKKSSLKNKRYM